MKGPRAIFHESSRRELRKLFLLSSWFFLIIATLWLLKPLRSATLLAHLGSEELPYIRLGSMIVIAIVVALYAPLVDRLTRIQVAVGASVLFSVLLIAFWLAHRLGGEQLGTERWFVWSLFILVDIDSTVMVGVFWTYTNDVMTRDEADRLYGPIGVGGIIGGMVGGALVDSLSESMGAINVMLLGAGLGFGGAAIVWWNERTSKPEPRTIELEAPAHSRSFDAAREVFRSPYLMLIAGVVVGYEFAAATTDYAVSVVFERAFESEVELARMFGRLGWIVSATALVSQLAIVPVLLPYKKIALVVSPMAMLLSAIGLSILPVVVMAIVLSAADRGLNYSLHQVTKETLYVPLSDAQKYKAKAFIDMFVDRTAKALSAIVLIVVIANYGTSITISLAIAIAALVFWLVCAVLLGQRYAKTAYDVNG
jgi:AAA family ATP:ADP antiporter